MAGPRSPPIAQRRAHHDAVDRRRAADLDVGALDAAGDAEVATNLQLTTRGDPAVQVERPVCLDVAGAVVEVAIDARRRCHVDATGPDARKAIDRGHQSRSVRAHEHVLTDLDGGSARGSHGDEVAEDRVAGLAGDGHALHREHRACRHRPEAARLHGPELCRQRQLAVLGLDRASAPRDLLREREAGEAPGYGILADAVHDPTRCEERVHALGVRRRARDTLDEQAPDHEPLVRGLVLEAVATARVPFDRERGPHRVARQLDEELAARLLVGRPGLDGLAVQDVAGPRNGRQAVDLDDDTVLPVEQRRPASGVRRLDDHAAARDCQRPVSCPLACTAGVHHDSPALSAHRPRELT